MEQVKVRSKSHGAPVSIIRMNILSSLDNAFEENPEGCGVGAQRPPWFLSPAREAAKVWVKDHLPNRSAAVDAETVLGVIHVSVLVPSGTGRFRSIGHRRESENQLCSLHISQGLRTGFLLSRESPRLATSISRKWHQYLRIALQNISGMQLFRWILRLYQ
jgi:hypothetical protein